MRYPKGGTGIDSPGGGGRSSPPEENADLPYFTSGCAHLLLQVVYGDFPHHNYGFHLDGGVTYDAICHRSWC